jgi:pantothenate synthetase
VLAASRAILEADPDLRIDRLDLVHPETLVDATAGPARLLVAAILPGSSGPVRLIDNIALTLGIA